MENEETIQMYWFYLYHRAIFEKEESWLCNTCEENGNKNGHDDDDDDDDPTKFYMRSNYVAYLYPRNKKKLEYSLEEMANYCTWMDWDDNIHKFEDGENIEEVDTTFVCIPPNNKEMDARKYLVENNIHLNCVGSGITKFSEWHKDGVHYNYK